MAIADRTGGSMTVSYAADIAIAALGYIAADPERLERFLALSGLGPQNLRISASDPGFLAAVLDYLHVDERLLVAFAAERGGAPEDVVRARDALCGGPPREA